MDSDIRPVLVLGIGNILLGDEGVGVRAVEALQSLPLPDGVEVVDGGTGGADLVDLLADRRRVIVIDAMESDGPAGTIRRAAAEEVLPSADVRLSLHELGLFESLRMARIMGCEPGSVTILGIQPQRVRPDLELSSEVAAAIPRVISAVLAELGEP